MIKTNNLPSLIELMKKRIKESEYLNRIMEEMVSDGLDEDEAMNVMISAWVRYMVGD